MKQLFQNRPSGRQIAVATWRGFIGALTGMPLLFIVFAVAFVALHYGTQYAGQKLELTDPFLDGMDSDDAWFYGLKFLAAVLLGAPVAMGVTRLVLLDKVGIGFFTRGGRAFLILALALTSLCLALLYLKGIAAAPPLEVLRALMWIVLVMAPAFLLFCFPAMAANVEAPSFSARLEAGLQQWNGNFLLFLRALFWSLGPVVLLIWVPYKAIANRGGQAFLDGIQAMPSYSIVLAALTPFLIGLVAAFIATFYAWSHQSQNKV